MFFDAMGLQRANSLRICVTQHLRKCSCDGTPGCRVDKARRWLLVTSAFHMPRSMATFAKVRLERACLSG
ncbi:MAG: YdcF family protein [Burkholderiales bacterium]|nr:YdcF family protein [Burkholderiales bacterium]